MNAVIVGPAAIGTPYGTALSDLLASKGLREAIIASAFLTEAGAEQLVDALRRAPKKARTTVIVGSMAGFTRKAAIRYLQSFTTGKNKKLIPSKLNLVQPIRAEPRQSLFSCKGPLHAHREAEAYSDHWFAQLDE